MRLLLVLTAFTLAAACGSNPTTNNPPPSPFAVDLDGTPTDVTAGNGDVTITIQLKVTEKATGDTAPNHNVILQVTAGTTAPTLPITNGLGRTTFTWLVLAADATSGGTQTIAYCAPANASGTQCGTNINGSQAYHHPF